MALIKVRNRWVNLAGPCVLSAVIFTGVLVSFGDSFGHAIAFSLACNGVAALLGWRRGRGRAAQQRRQQHAVGT